MHTNDDRVISQSRAGDYLTQIGGYRAFVPKPLPPDPPIQLDNEMLQLLSQADRVFPFNIWKESGREPLHHRVFSTRKVKISSSYQWDILANLIAPVHSPKYIDIQCVGIHKQLHISKTLRSGDILKDAQRQYLPSVFPRIAAAICALLLIGSVSLVGVGGIALIGPMFTHGDNAAHADGKILSIGPGRNFVLVTSNGQHLFFQCMDQCLASLAHMQRHLRERAHTDVYFIHGPDKSLMALNVD